MVKVTASPFELAGRLGGLKVAVAPDGKPVAEKVTASGKVPEPADTLRVKLAASPAVTVCEGGELVVTATLALLGSMTSVYGCMPL
jgi:hypothetical protein